MPADDIAPRRGAGAELAVAIVRPGSGGNSCVQANRFSRRAALKLGAAATALPLVHIRTGRAAGKVAIGFWDHWVPGGNDVMQKQCDAWADKNKVEVQADFITTAGNKLR